MKVLCFIFHYHSKQYKMTNHCVEVLLIDDNMEDAELTRRELKKHNMANHIVHLKNGKEALDFIFAVENLNNPPKVVLLDIQMPIIDGYTAASTLRAKGYSKPILAVTAHAMKDEKERCIKAGCDDHISKPVDMNSLIKTVAKHADIYADIHVAKNSTSSDTIHLVN